MTDAEEVQFKEVFSLILAGLAGLAVLFLVIALVIGRSQADYTPPGLTHAEAVAQRVAPAGEVNMGGPKIAESSAAAGDEGSGGGGDAAALETAAQVYDAVCASCHAQGIAGAPETGSREAWQQRLDQRGLQTLYDHAINGFNAMPAKGGMSSLSDEQVRGAVDHILSESGLDAQTGG